MSLSSGGIQKSVLYESNTKDCRQAFRCEAERRSNTTEFLASRAQAEKAT
jgi:hypothetical protein